MPATIDGPDRVVAEVNAKKYSYVEHQKQLADERRKEYNELLRKKVRTYRLDRFCSSGGIDAFVTGVLQSLTDLPRRNWLLIVIQNDSFFVMVTWSTWHLVWMGNVPEYLP